MLKLIKLEIKIKGAIFWMVIKMKQFLHFNPNKNTKSIIVK